MKIFVSSLIGGFEQERAAVKRAITALGHEPIMAENFGAQPNSPQIACLRGVRESDLIILVLGGSYGATQQSGLSATHEEYRDAQNSKPIIAFVQEGVQRDVHQAEFVSEVQTWEGGLFRDGFSSSDQLQDFATRAIHNVDLARAIGPVDEQELIARAVALMARESQRNLSSAILNIAVVGGPKQMILRPVEIEAQSLAEAVLKDALFGIANIFDKKIGNDITIKNGNLVLSQNSGASIYIDENGSIFIQLPLDNSNESGHGAFGGMLVILEEVVQEGLTKGLAYVCQIAERIDATQRLTHIAIAASITNAEHMAWRTQAQHAASPRSMSLGQGRDNNRSPIQLFEKSSALRVGRHQIVEDLLVLLRRQFPAGG